MEKEKKEITLSLVIKIIIGIICFIGIVFLVFDGHQENNDNKTNSNVFVQEENVTQN